ncbi:hypothetical protein MWG12_08615 [Fusobacterium necrophorum]|uniref:hypothetical protein n=1 Tax=Fusobacterium necrophorum TaxID=859 RepID=UPI0025505485|nr:hypothetical protein [Fusobacterium necrophorum]MDK4472294.1 hypothetical protein [Fusobacterium necrophorum]MDK4479292.1 hypothetical protein [Fusobacterium necrophorum]MDK4517997.1 hypothetical protein [Fusobacterium necrophorum]
MTFDGALVKEQGVTFAIVVVKSYVLSSLKTREDARKSFAKYFPLGIPIILMAQDSRGVPTYHGRKDIVNFLSNIDFRRIPWKTYTY